MGARYASIAITTDVEGNFEVEVEVTLGMKTRGNQLTFSLVRLWGRLAACLTEHPLRWWESRCERISTATLVSVQIAYATLAQWALEACGEPTTLRQSVADQPPVLARDAETTQATPRHGNLLYTLDMAGGTKLGGGFRSNPIHPLAVHIAARNSSRS